MNYFKKKADDIVRNRVISLFHPITVHPGACRYNYRCQMNAVHEAIEHDEKRIAMCICFDHEDPSVGQPFIHFININNENEYFDNTLGHHSQYNYYYLVRLIYDYDFINVNVIFDMFRKEIQRWIPWYIRIFISFDHY